MSRWVRAKETSNSLWLAFLLDVSCSRCSEAIDDKFDAIVQEMCYARPETSWWFAFAEVDHTLVLNYFGLASPTMFGHSRSRLWASFQLNGSWNLRSQGFRRSIPYQVWPGNLSRDGKPVVFLSCMHIHTHTYIHTYIHTWLTDRHTYIHTHTETYIHTYIHTHTETYIHTYINTYVHTYIH